MEDIDDEELDDILDRALEEFEEEELNKISKDIASNAGLTKNNGTKKSGTHTNDDDPSVDQLLKEQHKDSVTSELNKMIQDLEDPVNAETLRSTYEALSGQQEGANTLDQFLAQIKEKERLSAQGIK